MTSTTPPTTSTTPPSPTAPLPSPLPSSPNGEGYLKLLFESFEYVLPSATPFPPSLILGRKLPAHTPHVLPIAADRNISRQHAKLEWVRGLGWYVECLGKNGMFVDDAFVKGDGRVRLSWEGEDGYHKMQIGDVIFFVIRPLTQQP